MREAEGKPSLNWAFQLQGINPKPRRCRHGQVEGWVTLTGGQTNFNLKSSRMTCGWG